VGPDRRERAAGGPNDEGTALPLSLNGRMSTSGRLHLEWVRPARTMPAGVAAPCDDLAQVRYSLVF